MTSSYLKNKYPSRLPVIVESKIQQGEFSKPRNFLVPKDLTFGQFLYIIRKRMRLHPSVTIFLFTNGNIIPPSCMSIASVYNQYVCTDGFLYLYIAKESAFG